jgi:hypothetical protein
MNMTETFKTYSELLKFKTFDERFNYLVLKGNIGEITFGFDRYINQQFYTSKEWKTVRQHVILRDKGCDLGILDYEINDILIVHHINPMVSDDIVHNESWIFDPEFLITTSKKTHNAIHYGGDLVLKTTYAPRSRGDTDLW